MESTEREGGPVCADTVARTCLPVGARWQTNYAIRGEYRPRAPWGAT